ncbi:hydroxypyruvate isomerase family protein [Pandoraea nosoerga]|uniref:Hydroxypyruvate isomerase n=1 Tax=Pandoraea nosoerga TaxID=2508296 RepID=A0A5E4UKX5_9BURK|nr:2-oxo-tetronate isomerase [Pandoraea nosoerga]MBN4664750.1 hydroxypyruvate isomerase family protein [Pandoraea nosoerga]MBN4674076.1 hydroxypyruvate isomerase family protein [Pandoraea nosoerga]MBN4679990.1 hydroxypyruvate isomerase family protein [Pandoraea nosoerga]MBN4744295.1 hydroxypyruvate isomerase family protein [Pandoraea nosoerga]VVE00566.1 hydroxypyruvate isomerase [Pandoraea nosoerga]
MPRFAANLTLLYQEVPFLERFREAASDGFRGVECLFPYEHCARDIRARLDDAGLTQVLFNTPAGDWASGERGLAALPGREAQFRDGVELALDYADALGCRQLHVMAGCPDASQSPAQCRAVYLENLAYASEQAAAHGVTLLIEPINVRDFPRYFLTRQDQAHAIRQEVGASNLKVQFDAYHCQIAEGDLAMKLRQHIADIAHVQAAGVPARHEPDTGEVNYPFIFRLLDELGYSGWVGCEYRPQGETRAGLGWLKPWLRATR